MRGDEGEQHSRFKASSMRRIFKLHVALLVCAAAGESRASGNRELQRLLVAQQQLQSASSCDETDLKRDAMGLLTAHFDVELGAVAPGDAAHVGFQHLKTADALFAAQAIAHDDFDRAAAQFRNVLKYQRGDGQLPHIVYGASVPSHLAWLDTNKTFYPGPAFWRNSDTTRLDAVDDVKDIDTQHAAALVTSSVLAPPIAADVAWQIFQLSPYETVLGIVGYKENAVKFLCDAYAPLKELQELLLTTRAVNNSKTGRNLLLASHHPWETFSSLSPHWISHLSKLKSAADYANVTKSISEQAKARFATGARPLYSPEVAVGDLYEPMIYLAECVHKRLSHDSSSGTTADPCGFQVYDTEFNALAVRSAHALVQIARVLLDQSSVCSDFKHSREQMVADISALRAVEANLKIAILGGSNSTENRGLWNSTAKFFDDSKTWSSTAVYSLRGVMPGYAFSLPQDMNMGIVEHFLAPAEGFHFFCHRFPAPFFTCTPELGSQQTTLTLYNYFLQRAFTNNEFPGIAEYIRNKTRDMVCEASGRASLYTETPLPALFALAYDSQNAKPIDDFGDGFVGSTLAAAAFLNILLPAVAAPPSPDAPPVDHRILTVIMCIELVVAIVVALGCFLFSVYFVIKRPREAQEQQQSAGGGGMKCKLGRVASARKQASRADSNLRDEVEGGRRSSSHGDRVVYSDLSDVENLEESLLSDDEDLVYGSFDSADREQPQQESSSWGAVKDVLAAISPW